MGPEATIEFNACEWARKNGWRVYKFCAPGQRSVPDRLFIRQGAYVFIEFKAPGKKPTPQQALRIRDLQTEGCIVHVCDSVEAAVSALTAVA